MKKALNISLTYLAAALAGGVFYREFTKFNNFTGVTALGKLHTHLFLLGTGIFLFAALFSLHLRLEDEKTFRNFMIIYNIGLPLTAFMMFVRGVFQSWGPILRKVSTPQFPALRALVIFSLERGSSFSSSH